MLRYSDPCAGYFVGRDDTVGASEVALAARTRRFTFARFGGSPKSGAKVRGPQVRRGHLSIARPCYLCTRPASSHRATADAAIPTSVFGLERTRGRRDRDVR